MQITKLDDNNIEVTKNETKETVQTYNYDFLLKQRESIKTDRDRMIELKTAELAEVEELISQAEELGVKRNTPVAEEEVII